MIWTYWHDTILEILSECEEYLVWSSYWLISQHMLVSAASSLLQLHIRNRISNLQLDLLPKQSLCCRGGQAQITTCEARNYLWINIFIWLSPRAVSKIYRAQDNSQIPNPPDNSPAQSWYACEHQHEQIEVSKACKHSSTHLEGFSHISIHTHQEQGGKGGSAS